MFTRFAVIRAVEIPTYCTTIHWMNCLLLKNRLLFKSFPAKRSAFLWIRQPVVACCPPVIFYPAYSTRTVTDLETREGDARQRQRPVATVDGPTTLRAAGVAYQPPLRRSLFCSHRSTDGLSPKVTVSTEFWDAPKPMRCDG